MENGHQILHQLLVRTQRFGVEYQQFALLLLTQMSHEIKAERRQAIFMCDDHLTDFTSNDAIDEREETLAVAGYGWRLVLSTADVRRRFARRQSEHVFHCHQST